MNNMLSKPSVVRVVVVGAIAVVLAIGLVLLMVVTKKIAKGEPDGRAGPFLESSPR
jgi:hypothetical protein